MKKGFTLIELLAVIVVLAIIALIAVPIVLNIINDSKNSSDEQSIELYTKQVEKQILKQQLSNSNFNPNKCTILSNGNLHCNNDQEDLGIVNIDMKGTMPSGGMVLINNNKISFKNIELNSKIYFETIVNLIKDVGENGISVGDKYSYKVNNEDRFYFYVLTDPLDGNVSLIMDRNICEDGTVAKVGNLCMYEWHEPENDNNYGPDTAMIKLYNATKNWINVPDMIMSYINNTEGYESIITDINTKETTILPKQNKVTINQKFGNITHPLKARLPEEREVKTENLGCTEETCSCSSWLVENLEDASSWCNNCFQVYSETSKIQGIYGYWLLAGSGEGGAKYVSSGGNIYYTLVTNQYGIRPVITVPMEDLEQ